MIAFLKSLFVCSCSFIILLLSYGVESLALIFSAILLPFYVQYVLQPDNYHFWRRRDFWANIPYDWVYSYNRGKSHPDDLETHKYRKECKICLFNVDNTPNNQGQIKIDELQNEELLRIWHDNPSSKSA